MQRIQCILFLFVFSIIVVGCGKKDYSEVKEKLNGKWYYSTKSNEIVNNIVTFDNNGIKLVRIMYQCHLL